MYVIEYKRRSDPRGGTYLLEHLHEMTAAQFRKVSIADNDDHWHDRVSASVAHDVVRHDRFPHSTNLWLEWDEFGHSRIRKY